ncbi:hypothetical protein QVN42_00040 [Yersinia nurmii]|uniref:Uncharacterized protein n=1 Tax=Yersinia nurmii TaxID=685706 RepID=A0AAW7JXU2_9GAMM|nr:hypothetical protein [Yersinia nurmii]MDN0085795.1 hypothetical protein [Yersinia nurmii]
MISNLFWLVSRCDSRTLLRQQATLGKISGKLSKNTQRQPKVLTRILPATAPIANPSPFTTSDVPIARPCFFGKSGGNQADCYRIKHS